MGGKDGELNVGVEADVEDLLRPTQLQGGADGGRLTGPRFHQVSSRAEGNRFVIDVHQPAVRLRCVGDGGGLPSPP